MLKSFIKPSSSECLPPLYDTDNDTMVTDVNAKASLLNSFFVTQTRLNENDQALPTELLGNDQYSLTSVFIDSLEVRDVLINLNFGDPSLPSNYRPISLLNTMEKVFERILYKHIFNYLNENSFFTPYQSGFLPGDSTVNQVTFPYNKICNAVDEGLEIRFIFFDISKAFDKVWHKSLIFKLRRAGINGKLLGWLSITSLTGVKKLSCLVASLMPNT